MSKIQATVFALVGVCVAGGANCVQGLNFSLTDNTNTTSEAPSGVGAAIAAVFANGQQQAGFQLKSNVAIPDIIAGQPAPTVSSTCAEFEGVQGAEGPDQVTSSATITAGTYGATDMNVTVTADQDCESDANNDDAFMSFEITEEIVANCEDGTTVTLLPGSSGIARNNESAGYYPEIYGTFNVRDHDGTEYDGILCTIFLGLNEEVLESSCEESDGTDIDTSGPTCQFDTN